MSSPDPVTTNMPWGLHLIHDESSNSGSHGVTADIIAVHGLGAHPDHAWVRHKDDREGIQADVRWLTDLLPQTLRDHQPSVQVRVFCFNYQSAWLGSKLSRNRLENIAGRLLDDIHHIKLKDSNALDRPLIFVGHSFGGLVIEQAVVKANSSGSAYEYLVDLIGGVVFLGTPHQGSKTQKWGAILAQLANLIEYGQTSLMDNVDEKSMKIFDLRDEFMQIMIRTDLAKTHAVVCFCENRPTDYLRRVVTLGDWVRDRTSSMVVEIESAVLPGFRYVTLDSDHLKLNKFANMQDGNYQSVSSNLARIAVQASGLIQDRLKKASSEYPTHFLVDRERVKNFIGREPQLLAIVSYFSIRDETRHRILILHALGGQGKTQTALEYCQRSRKTYRSIFWIDANSEATAMLSFQKVSTKLNRGFSTGLNNDESRIRFVHDTLGRYHERWLLVFDNYDLPNDFPSVKRFIPSGKHGDVLFTSRNNGLGRLGTLLEIPPMTNEDGVQLLLSGHDKDEIERHMAEGSNIVTRLGGLALAIDQAAAYIEYKKFPLERLSEFLATYEEQREQVLQYTPPEFWEYGTMQIQDETKQNKVISAFTTWEMSFQQLESDDERRRTSIAYFLTLSAFFNPANIGEFLFRWYWEAEATRPEWMHIFCSPYDEESSDDSSSDNGLQGHKDSGCQQIETWDSDKFWDLIAKSHKLSLVQSISSGNEQGGTYFSLHPVIRDWLQLRGKAKKRQQYIREAIDIVLKSLQKTETFAATAEQKALLTAHVDTCLSNDMRFSKSQHIFGRDVKDYETARWFASFYRDQGRYKSSERIMRLVFEAQVTTNGEEHHFTLASLANLATLLSSQAKYKEAEEMTRWVLKLSEKVLGKGHIDTLATMNNLATQLSKQGKYEEAEGVYQKTLKLVQAVLGEDHRTTLATMNNLAGLWGDLGKMEEAEGLYLRTLKLQEATLGKDHSDTLNTVNNLALVLGDQGKYEQAEEMYRQTLKLCERLQGREHPGTITSMNNLALVLGRQGKYKQAEEIHRQELKLCERLQGREHPGTITSMNNLAQVLDRQGKYKQAEEMNRQTLKLAELVLGKEHPSTLTSMNNLALLLSNQGKYEEAEEMHQRTLILQEKTLGKGHPGTLTSMNNLAQVLGRQGKHKQAEKIHRQTLKSNEMGRGKEHPATLLSMNNLALVLSDQGNYEESEAINRQTVELMERVLGKEHPDTLTNIGNLALVLRRQGKYKEADEINQRTLMLQKKVLGMENPSTILGMNNTAEVLVRLGRFQEAEELHLRALELAEKVLGPVHPTTMSMMHNLADVQSCLGKYKEEEKMRRRTLNLREKALGKEHSDTLTAMFCLAHLLQTQENYGEASVLYEIALPALRKVLGDNHPTTMTCYTHYTSMLEAQNARVQYPLPSRPAVSGKCQLCPKEGKLCLGCNQVWYCSKEHQKADWKNHKSICRSK